jgi:hypothetical protein
MIKFIKPLNLNGSELRNELRNAGIEISDDMFAIEDDNAGNILLAISESDAEKAEAVVAAHNGTTVAPEPTVADKLASVGLNLDDLKAALGL